jgi:hypothetical protein
MFVFVVCPKFWKIGISLSRPTLSGSDEVWWQSCDSFVTALVLVILPQSSVVVVEFSLQSHRYNFFKCC